MRRFGIVVAVLAAVGLVGVPTAAVAAGTRPAIVTASLSNGGRPCATDAPVELGRAAGTLQAVGRTTGDTTSGLRFTFEVWPVTDPDTVTRLEDTTAASGRLASVGVSDGVLTSGVGYAWRVRVADRATTSPWSPTCRFLVDTDAPQPPTITSNYPTADEGQSPTGQRARFVLRASGDRSVAGYEFGWNEIPVFGCENSGPQGQLVCPDFPTGPYVVRAASLGGSATVVLDPPSPGIQRLVVASLDRAGNRSTVAHYEIDSPDTSPAVTIVGRPAICGRTAVLSLRPAAGLTRVASYTVSVDGRAAATVPAAADGTATAQITVAPGSARAEVVSVSRSGFRSTHSFLQLDVRPEPDVTSDVYVESGQPVGGVGVVGTFTFTGPFDGTWPARYTYRFDDGPTLQVPFDQETLQTQVTWSPTHTGPTTLTVRSVDSGDAGASCASAYSFVVAG